MDKETRIFSIAILLTVAGACLIKPEIFTDFFNPVFYKAYYNLIVNNFPGWLIGWTIVLAFLIYSIYILFDRIIVKRIRIKNIKARITIFFLIYAVWINITLFEVYKFGKKIVKAYEKNPVPVSSLIMMPVVFSFFGYFVLTRVQITSDLKKQTLAAKVNLLFEYLSSMLVMFLLILVNKYSSTNIKFNPQEFKNHIMFICGLGFLSVIVGALSFLCRIKKGEKND